MNATTITHGLKAAGGLIGMGMTGGLGLAVVAGVAVGVVAGVACSAYKHKHDASCRDAKRIGYRNNFSGCNCNR